MENQTIIRITDTENITVEKKGLVMMPPKSVKYNQIAQAFYDSIDVYEIQTPVLPKGCIHYAKHMYGREYVVIEREKCQRPLNYYGSWFKNVGFPKLILGIGIQNGLLTTSKLAAVKDAVTTPKTEVYLYPYSNVHSHNFEICWGNYRQEKIEELYQLSSLLDIFLGLEMNGDLYRGVMPYREILEEMSDKEFNENLLHPADCNFEQFLKKLKGDD